MSKQSKYKNLSMNTLLFTISSFGAKIISFLLVPIYTSVLSTKDYGNVDLVSTTVQLLIPIATLNIQDAVLRFSLDDKYEAEEVIGAGMKLILGSSSVLGVILLIVSHYRLINIDKDYLLFLFFSFFFGVINNCFSMYLKAKNKVKILTVSGLVNTFITCFLNILLLVVIRLGVTGYLISNVVGTGIAITIMFFWGNIYKESKMSGSTKLLKAMILYSLPLVMNALAWWLNNASDRYILTFFCGTAINGIYAVSYKIPTILSTIQTIFYNAWSISAITEFDKDDRDGFIGNIYTIYSGISFIACSVIIMCNIFLARILYAKDFFDAWKFVPVLLTGTVFNGIALFEGCIFTAVKKTREVSNTTLVGAAINTVLNLLLIPFIGALGAAIATMVGYAIIWIVRTKRMLKIVAIKVNWSKQLTMMIALIVQSIVASSGKNFYIQVICMVVIIYKQKDIVKKIFNRLVKKESIK